MQVQSVTACGDFYESFFSQEFNRLQQLSRWSNDLWEVFLLFTKLREYKTKTKLQLFLTKCNLDIA